MDRFSYKGPVWEENKGPPKTSMEEKDPIYNKIDGEQHPSEREDAKHLEGEKRFETVVR